MNKSFFIIFLFINFIFAQSIILVEDEIDRRIFERRIAPEQVLTTPPSTNPKTLKIKSHLVTINVTDQVAVTEIDQVFYNPFKRQMEGHYLFPLPADANVNQFSMWMNGKEVHAEILERSQATQIYQSIVSRRRDPGLLELVGTQLLKVHVFPIPAQADTRIKLSYTNTLKKDSGMMEVHYPINTSKFTNYPVGQCSILVKVKNQKGIATVYSPTHDMDVAKKSDHEAIGSWEKSKHNPTHNFKLYITESDKSFGIHGLTHRLPGEEGYYMMMISPKQDEIKEVAKDVIFVIDTSGSMAGDKINQTKQALEYCISKIKPQDRFNIIPFSTEARFFAESLQESNENNIARAQSYIKKLLPRGGTNIDEALNMAMGMLDKDRLSIVLFLTDGLPTIGERNINTILKNVKTSNTANASLFAFGAGNEINTNLLDKLASQNNGTQEYVSEKEDIKLKIARFFDKLSSPVMTDVKVKYVGFHPTDVYPKKLPNIFKGSTLLLTGRYDTAGSKAIQLVGTIEGKEVVLTDEVQFQERIEENDFIPRIWANRKVGYLMEEIRTHGVNNELKKEIIRLGKKFGIVTPYTSFLAVEESELANLPPGTFRGGRSNAPSPEESRKELNRIQLLRRDFEEAQQGAGAVKQSEKTAKHKAADSLEATLGASFDDEMDEAGDKKTGRKRQQIVKMVGSKTFVKRGNAWVDSKYSAKDKENLTKITAFSKEYFELMQKHTAIAKFLSVGKNIVLVYKGKSYHIVTK